MDTQVLLVLCLLAIAFLYSSVGHGGASGYLAIMAIFGIQHEYMRSSALILNLFVSGLAFYTFFRSGFFRWRLLWPFLITSMPAAFIGARLHLTPTLYKVILGLFLIVAIYRLLFTQESRTWEKRVLPLWFGLLVGVIIGFLSGLIGIGGGILLTPILLIGRFADNKEASTVSALFIFLNSLMGLSGLITNGIQVPSYLSLWIAAAFAGGVIGAYTGSRRLSDMQLRTVLSLVLLFATIKLFLV